MLEDFIKSTVEAGHEKLGSYEFASSALRPVKLKSAAPAAAAAGVAGEPPEGDDELQVHFRLNATGNVWYATTTKADLLEEETKELFNSVLVLYAAMTKVMAGANKSLFDFDEWSKMIRTSGFFIEVGKVQKIMSIGSATVSIDTQILSQLLQGIAKAPSALEIGKEILSALKGEYSGKAKKEEAKIGHLLFICEEIMGASSVSVRLFFADSKQMELMTKSPCHKSESQSYEQEQRIDTFRFVSPEQISKYAKKFKDNDPDYMALVKKLQESLAS
jgi:hypothetical protein